MPAVSAFALARRKTDGIRVAGTAIELPQTKHGTSKVSKLLSVVCTGKQHPLCLKERRKKATTGLRTSFAQRTASVNASDSTALR